MYHTTDIDKKQSAPAVPLPDPSTLPKLLRESPHWILWKTGVNPKGGIAKLPCDHTGTTCSYHDHHSDLATAIERAKKLRTRSANYGVGLAFSDDMGFVCIDLDHSFKDGVRAEHLDWVLNTFPTFGEVSISGNGAHVFFRGKFPKKQIVIVDGGKFEIFGTTGFIAFTGNAITGTPSELADFDEIYSILEPHLQRKRTTSYTQTATSSDRIWGETGLRNQCDRVRNAPDKTLHYTLCSASCSVGRLVPKYLDFEVAEKALYEATEQAGGEDMNNALKTIRGQLRFGMQDPSPGPQDKLGDHCVEVDLSEFGTTTEADEEEIEEKPTRTDPGWFPKHLLKVPGFIGEVVDYTNRNSFIVHPVMSLAGALALMSVLTGRKITDDTDIRTNCYILSVAPSGEGKEAGRKTNTDILFAAGADRLMGGGWASGAGLLTVVRKKLAVLFQNDEIGRVLQTTSDPKKAPHLYSINSNLLKLYSTANTVFFGDSYADDEKNTNIVNPHCVLYGTTVPGALYESMTEDSITGGLMGRMLIFEANQADGILQDGNAIPPPDSVVKVAKKWANWRTGSFTSINPAPFVVPCDGDAAAMFKELRIFGREQSMSKGDMFGSLWVRCAENAKKLALLYGCSEHFGEAARITLKAAHWACEVARYLVARQCWMASKFIARNATESGSLALERMIREAGSKGLSATEINRRNRHLTRRDREEHLAGLIEGNVVNKVIVKSGGRPCVIYVAS